MLEKLTIDIFANRIGEPFTIWPDDTVRIPATLSVVPPQSGTVGVAG